MNANEKLTGTSLLAELLNFESLRGLALDEKLLNLIIGLGEANNELKQKCKVLYNSYFDSESYDFYEAELRVRRLTAKYL